LFRQRERLERWADDMVLVAEKELADTRAQIKAANRQARLAGTLEGQHATHEKIHELEKQIASPAPADFWRGGRNHGQARWINRRARETAKPAYIYGTPIFAPAQALSGDIKKGEHGTKVVFWKIGEYQKENAETAESKLISPSCFAATPSSTSSSARESSLLRLRRSVQMVKVLRKIPIPVTVFLLLAANTANQQEIWEFAGSVPWRGIYRARGDAVRGQKMDVFHISPRRLHPFILV
jgi:antirestriction factor ArdC-like protein